MIDLNERKDVEPKNKVSSYRSFTGADTVVMINGGFEAPLGIHTKYSGHGTVGRITIEYPRREKDHEEAPENSLLEIVYADEYGHVAHEAYLLLCLDAYETDISVDRISTNSLTYTMWRLKDFAPYINKAVFEMSDEDFSSLVARAHEITSDNVPWLSNAKENPVSNIANRVFYLTYKKIVDKILKTWKEEAKHND